MSASDAVRVVLDPLVLDANRDTGKEVADGVRRGLVGHRLWFER
jgi:hypothetical protein